MKLILILFAPLFSSCALYWVENNMQPDGSYKVEVAGNAFSGRKETVRKAHYLADKMCPHGYIKKAEVPYETFKPRYELIIKCKELNEKH